MVVLFVRSVVVLVLRGAAFFVVRPVFDVVFDCRILVDQQRQSPFASA